MKFIFIALSFLILSLNSLALATTPEIIVPEKYDFNFTKEERLDISNRNFCRVQASVTTYNKTFNQTNKEVVAIVCDGKNIKKGGPVKSILKADERLNEILAGTVGEFVAMRFYVVSCNIAAEKFEATCFLAKSLAVNSK